MKHGIYRMSAFELDEALEAANACGAIALAERLAAEINEPGKLYVYPVRGNLTFGYSAKDCVKALSTIAKIVSFYRC